MRERSLGKVAPASSDVDSQRQSITQSGGEVGVTSLWSSRDSLKERRMNMSASFIEQTLIK